MQFTSSLFLIAHMAAGALALSGDGAACQLNIECLSGYCMPHTGSNKYVCWGQRRKGGQYKLCIYCQLHNRKLLTQITFARLVQRQLQRNSVQQRTEVCFLPG